MKATVPANDRELVNLLRLSLVVTKPRDSAANSDRVSAMVGRRFGRLVVTGFADTVRRNFRWNVVCDCGGSAIVMGYSLTGGSTRSCGCLTKERTAEQNKTLRQRRTHGKRKTPEYNSWDAMHRRCNDKKNIAYANYGGRGIRVSDRWSSFEVFLSDMGSRPEGTSIDRINNDGNYEPGNCRWATRSQQAKNKRPRRTSRSHQEKTKTRTTSVKAKSE